MSPGRFRDLTYAFRSLRRAPGLTTVALIVLTLGIGASTAIFSVVDAVILRGLPFDEGDRLVTVGRVSLTTGRQVGDTAPDFLDWHAQQDVFERMAASTSTNFTVRPDGSGEPEILLGLRATADLFPLLRVAPALGRVFGAENEIAGRDRVVVISDGLWRRRFAANPAVLGKTMTTATGPWEIVGVMPPGFNYPAGSLETTDVYLPYVVSAAERVRGSTRIQSLDIVGRLKDGVTVEQARLQIERITEPLRLQYADWFTGSRVTALPLRDSIVGSTRSWMFMLLGAVALVLVIACVNVANLVLARTTARDREFAMRAALGATRWQLARSVLVESLLLATIGTACGVFLAWWGVGVLTASMPESLPRLAPIGIDLRVLVTAAVAAAATGILFGVLPALHASRAYANDGLKDGGRSATPGRGRQRIGAALVVAEVTLATILLVGAGLFVSSFARFVSFDLGLDPKNVLTVNAPFRASIAADDPNGPVRGRLFTIDMVDRLRRVPGVEAVAAVSGGLPLSGSVNRISLGLPARPDFRDPDGAEIRIVTPDYFNVLRIPVLRGRVFAESDRDSTPRVIVISDLAERAYFAGQDALGQPVNVNGAVCEVIGVVKGVRLGGPEGPMRLEAYLPVAQETIWTTSFVIRASTSPNDLLPAVKDTLRAVNPTQVIASSRTLEDYFERLIGARRFNMALLGLFGVLGLVIAVAGIYGVMAQVVGQRTPEIGVRIALGAAPSAILGSVVRRATVYVAGGLVCGMIGAFVLGRLVASFLFKVQPHDAGVYSAVSLILLAAGLLAAWVPARRAARVDPLVTLRRP